jgi:hypothetical protein
MSAGDLPSATAERSQRFGQEGSLPPDLDQAWQLNGRQRFEEAYADDDVVYEQLIHDATDR